MGADCGRRRRGGNIGKSTLCPPAFVYIVGRVHETSFLHLTPLFLVCSGPWRVSSDPSSEEEKPPLPQKESL